MLCQPGASDSVGVGSTATLPTTLAVRPVYPRQLLRSCKTKVGSVGPFLGVPAPSKQLVDRCMLRLLNAEAACRCPMNC
jgi:hypothetical protein